MSAAAGASEIPPGDLSKYLDKIVYFTVRFDKKMERSPLLVKKGTLKLVGKGVATVEGVSIRNKSGTFELENDLFPMRRVALVIDSSITFYAQDPVIPKDRNMANLTQAKGGNGSSGIASGGARRRRRHTRRRRSLRRRKSQRHH
jgi:hypothetical protein